MKKVVFILLVVLTLSSCENDDDNNNDSPSPISVTLTSTVTGTLSDSPTIEYRDSSGDLVTETLTTGTWEKTLSVSSGFNLLLKATGTIDGEIELKASATGDGVSYNNSINSGNNVGLPFELEISTML